jgi:dTDP-4-amino-4,6-dideoxygalactose transaminase
MAVPILDLKAQYKSIQPEVDVAISQVMDESQFSFGPILEKFEHEFADYCGAAHCIGVGNGTSALELMLRGHGIGSGDEVITATNSFFASSAAISLVGATPVLCDVLEETANMDPASFKNAITDKTKAVIVVHLYGQPADMDAIKKIAKEKNILVFEDAAQSHGALYKGQKTGSLGDSAAFSFYPSKNLGGCGEGGGVLTDDDAVAKKIRSLRHHGSSDRYHHEVVSGNHRMDAMQAAVLSVKLKHLDEWNAKRREHAEKYREKLAGSNVEMFDVIEGADPVYYLFVIKSKNRDDLMKKLEAKGIQSQIHYPIPIHLQKAYVDLGYKEGDLPIAEKLAKEILSIPMFAELTEAQIEEVCATIKECT